MTGLTDEDLLGAEIIELPNPEGLDPEEFLEPELEDPTEDIQDQVRRQLEEAIQHYEENLEPDQAEATKYYHGRPFGDEEKGRSKAVSTDVRDAIKAKMPSLMRIFFGSEDVLEFISSKGPEGEAQARQATDYVNHVIRVDNPGYRIIQGAFKDAEIRRLGIIKWWVEEHERVNTAVHSGLTEEQLALFEMEGIEYDILSQELDGTFSARVTRRESDKRVRIEGVPNEQFVYTPGARDLDSAPLVAHVREVPASELVEMGIDPDVIEEAKGQRKRPGDGDLADARLPYESDHSDKEGELDESMRPVLFAEAYVLIDTDGDAVAERRKFWCVGPDHKVVNGGGLGELVDEVPFADFTPDIEPHELEGRSTWDDLKDVQRIASQILRGTLNSLALSIDPATEVVTNEVNMSDLLNPEMGKFIRVRRPGMMREIKHSFVGPDTLPMLEYFQSVKENRTGVSKAAAGLDADALQSSTQAAVAATVSASHQQVELVARNFAEGGMKRLMRGVLKATVQHANRPRVIRLRGQYVEMDPRAWDVDMDVEVNVALGSGLMEERFAVLGMVLQDQGALMEAGSPLVSWVEMRATREKMIEMSGFKDASAFYKPWGPEEQAQWEEAQANQQPEPDAAMLLVQVEMQKVQAAVQEAQAKLQNEQQKLALEREKLVRQSDHERDKLAREFQLKLEELKLKSQEFEVSAVMQAVEADRAQQDADLKAVQAQSDEMFRMIEAFREEQDRAKAAQAEAEAAAAAMAQPPESPEQLGEIGPDPGPVVPGGEVL
jgi:hypothetical protein